MVIDLWYGYEGQHRLKMVFVWCGQADRLDNNSTHTLVPPPPQQKYYTHAFTLTKVQGQMVKVMLATHNTTLGFLKRRL